MKYRILGKTNLKISEIGYGTWQLANDPGFWSGSDTNESLKCLHKYVELGGNFIDTAWIYGYSVTEPDKHPSEELIGKFLKGNGERDKIVIASKIPPKNMFWPARKSINISEVFPVEHIEKCVDDSLRSLGVEYIDLMQFHVWQDDFSKEDDWKKTIQKITKQGKVRNWGISLNDYQPANCIKTLDTGLISSVQCIFNLFHQKPTEKLFPYAAKNNIGIIARVPLDEGGLSGRFDRKTVFSKDDFRSKYFTQERLEELVSRTDVLKKKYLNDSVETLAELSLRYILSFKEVSTLIVGMRKMEHVESNISYSDKDKLAKIILEELKQYAWERNFYPDVDPEMKESDYLEL
jgi:aryl-alcohol dehydrogenase-like predicted oxidoreductase